MHIKIYFNDKPLFLATELTPELEPYAHHDDAVLIDEFSTPGVNSMIHEMRQQKVHAGIYLHTDLEELQKAFWKKFQLVQAAGGLVNNPTGDLLFIFRRNKWDLPKGKLDPGETLETCAVREVEEETGLRKVQLNNHLVTTYHTYDESGHHILKETWWYRLSVPGQQELVPQTEEQITAVEWARPDALKKYTDNTFPSILDVLEAANYLQ
ncbi:MAG: NUDIX domain-containing protein [Candidatus Pseudobacter hemicellulosilyticus]|uniref:NUDIX domain-containing protein n=1 Tax=Candidatus Pseudobacter hemicellulosilyticus TaxID=3121375 RepID=A0AAJ6BFA0_9BACT|nr:MAG: NUDIX domain-containing protein [Pseudobacter sp.]